MPVTLKFPKNCGGVCVAGVSYAPTKKGLAAFPPDAVPELLQFGFVVAPPEDSMDQEAADAYLAAVGLQEQFDAGTAERAALAAQEQAQADALNQVSQIMGG